MTKKLCLLLLAIAAVQLYAADDKEQRNPKECAAWLKSLIEEHKDADKNNTPHYKRTRLGTSDQLRCSEKVSPALSDKYLIHAINNNVEILCDEKSPSYNQIACRLTVTGATKIFKKATKQHHSSPKHSWHIQQS